MSAEVSKSVSEVRKKNLFTPKGCRVFQRERAAYEKTWSKRWRECDVFE